MNHRVADSVRVDGASIRAARLLASLGSGGEAAAAADPPQMIVALMIGELKYQRTLNHITSQIVRAAVTAWQLCPMGELVCESEPMARFARQLGMLQHHLRVAIPDARGHTTRQVAEWLSSETVLPAPPSLWVVTHALHVDRARRIIERCGVRATYFGLDISFASCDLDWKLRSARLFWIYDRAAEIYCRCRGWL